MDVTLEKEVKTDDKDSGNFARSRQSQRAGILRKTGGTREKGVEVSDPAQKLAQDFQYISRFDREAWISSIEILKGATLDDGALERDDIKKALIEIFSMIGTVDDPLITPLVGQFLESLLIANQEEEICQWIEKNRPFIRPLLEQSSRPYEISAYETLVEKIMDRYQDKSGNDFSTLANQLPGIKYDLLAREIAESKFWDKKMFSGMSEDELESVQTKAISRLVHSLHHEDALRLLLDEQATVGQDVGLIRRVLKRDWFWGNADTAMKMIEQAQPGPARDSIISHSVDLMIPTAPGVAREWAGLIESETVRARVLERLVNE